MTRRRAKAPSQRQLRVGEQLRHLLADILSRSDVRDPELAEANVTVTEVRVSPDLKNATAFVTPFSGGDMEGVLKALQRAAPFFQRQLGAELNLRFTPRLRFQADRSFDEAARVEALLRQPRVQRDLHADDDDNEQSDTAGDADDGGARDGDTNENTHEPETER